MSEIDPTYYDRTLGRDPHFCTVCDLRSKQLKSEVSASLLNSLNYNAWVNYGMCQECMQYFLGFDGGIVVNDDRRKSLLKILSKRLDIKKVMNPHLRLHLFKQDRQKFKQQVQQKRRQQLRIGFKDQHNRRTCYKCDTSVVLNEHLKYSYDKCGRCGQKFAIQPMRWQI